MTVAVSERASMVLPALGATVRRRRGQLTMSRKALAMHSGVSERHLAQLESGRGNISIGLLERVAAALRMDIRDLFDTPARQSLEEALILERVRSMNRPRQRALWQWIQETYPPANESVNRIALVGLRGAGKSTLGRMLVDHLTQHPAQHTADRLSDDEAVPFVQLSAEIETLAGMGVAEIFSLSGRAGYERLQERALMQTLKRHSSCVIEISGSIVAQPELFDILLSTCFVVWLKAQPESYIQRVTRQGDLRPLQNRDDALMELKRILAEREPFLSRSHAEVDTSGLDIDDSLRAVIDVVNACATTGSPPGQTPAADFPVDRISTG